MMRAAIRQYLGHTLPFGRILANSYIIFELSRVTHLYIPDLFNCFVFYIGSVRSRGALDRLSIAEELFRLTKLLYFLNIPTLFDCSIVSFVVFSSDVFSDCN